MTAACLIALLGTGRALVTADASPGTDPGVAPGVAPRPGERVRVIFVREVPGVRHPIPRAIERTGILLAADTSGLRLEHRDPRRSQDPPREIRIPLPSLRRVQVKAGHSGWRGALSGVTWGTLAGMIAAAAVELADAGNTTDADSPSSLWLVPAGLGAGVLVGGAVGSDVWRDYPVSRWRHDLDAQARP